MSEYHFVNNAKRKEKKMKKFVTPDQYSAECEALRYEMEQAEGGAK